MKYELHDISINDCFCVDVLDSFFKDWKIKTGDIFKVIEVRNNSDIKIKFVAGEAPILSIDLPTINCQCSRLDNDETIVNYIKRIEKDVFLYA